VLTSIIRAILQVATSIKASGIENFQNAQGPFVFVANHSSHLDSVSIAATLPHEIQAQTFAVAAKDYFFDRAWKAFLFRLLINAIPFDRKKRVDEGMRKCREILDGGGSLVIFPEGTRSPDGKLQSFKSGVGPLLCGNKRVRAVPVYIKGAYELMPKGAKKLRSGKLELLYGKPISFAELDQSPENFIRVAKELEAQVAKLSAQANH
jgi:long-chain acyl-CoA synthetase